MAKSIWEGWRFVGRTRVVRGITIGMTGAFAAGGVVVGLGYGYVVTTLDGGAAGWGMVFAAVFVGLAAGMSVGLKVLSGFSRRRLFGLSIAAASVPLALVALIPNLVVVAILVVLLGASAGVAYVTGYTIIGSEVDDDTRGRTFAFLQSADPGRHVRGDRDGVGAGGRLLGGGHGDHRRRAQPELSARLTTSRPATTSSCCSAPRPRWRSGSRPTGRWTTAAACRCSPT